MQTSRDSIATAIYSYASTVSTLLFFSKVCISLPLRLLADIVIFFSVLAEFKFFAFLKSLLVACNNTLCFLSEVFCSFIMALFI